jgi:hypothetical protein
MEKHASLAMSPNVTTASTSPRISDEVLLRHPHATQQPAPHTAAELHALVDLLRTAGARTISIGHGRHEASNATAGSLRDCWKRGGGTVLATVSWPATAASWRRPARRLVRSQPDAWVIADNPAGCAQLTARLDETPDWTPLRTFGTASLYGPELSKLTGFGVLAGMSGACADGAMAHRIRRPSSQPLGGQRAMILFRVDQCYLLVVVTSNLD